MGENKPTVLITGSNGLLGSQLRHVLSQASFSLIATSIGCDRFPLDRHRYIQLNIESYNECQSVLNTYKPSIIVNTAAMTNVDACEKNQQKCQSVNADSIDNFIPYVQNNNAHLIQISTDMVFDGKKGGYSEKDICKPINFYGKTKLDAELKVLNNITKYTIIRTSMLYDVFGNNFLTWVGNKLKSNEQLSIVDDQYRTPTYVPDLIAAILQIIKLKKYGIYHVSSEEKLSIFDIVCSIANYLHLDSQLINRIKSKDLNQFAKRPFDSSLVVKKAKEEFGFSSSKLTHILKQIL